MRALLLQSFSAAIKQYLCPSLLKNGVSSVSQVGDVSMAPRNLWCSKSVHTRTVPHLNRSLLRAGFRAEAGQPHSLCFDPFT